VAPRLKQDGRATVHRKGLRTPRSPPRATNNRTPHHSLLLPWLLVSALWIAGVIFFESRDGKMSQEVVEVIAKCLLPPLIPPLLLAALVRIVAEHCRP
jgi:hypothetical protein